MFCAVLFFVMNESLILVEKYLLEEIRSIRCGCISSQDIRAAIAAPLKG